MSLFYGENKIREQRVYIVRKTMTFIFALQLLRNAALFILVRGHVTGL